MNLVQKLFSFQGRIRRRDWWLLGIAMAVIGTIVISVLDAALKQSGQTVRMVVNDGFVLLMNWMGFALSAKRMHDRGRSGWWLIVPLVVDVAAIALAVTAYFTMMAAGHDQNALSAAIGSAGLAGIVLMLLMLVVGIWLFIDLGCLDGAPGPNKYGPSPKAAAPAPAATVVQTA